MCTWKFDSTMEQMCIKYASAKGKTIPLARTKQTIENRTENGAKDEKLP